MLNNLNRIDEVIRGEGPRVCERVEPSNSFDTGVRTEGLDCDATSAVQNQLMREGAAAGAEIQAIQTRWRSSRNADKIARQFGAGGTGRKPSLICFAPCAGVELCQARCVGPVPANQRLASCAAIVTAISPRGYSWACVPARRTVCIRPLDARMSTARQLAILTQLDPTKDC